VNSALAVALAAAVAWSARRAGALTGRGAVAATVVGGVALSAGVPWGAFLIAWFIASSALSRLGRAAKARRTDGIVDKGGTRDAWQVLANGGVFTVCAAVGLGAVWLSPHVAATPETLRELAALAGAAALTAAGADTAATEVGTLMGGTPWSLRTRQRASPGMSGAVSLTGTAALVVAALLFAALAVALQLVPTARWGIVAWAGVAGAVADSLLGAWMQGRRWCPTCAAETEQYRHRCGTATQRAGGLDWITNDVVNVTCTIVGAAVALRLG